MKEDLREYRWRLCIRLFKEGIAQKKISELIELSEGRVSTILSEYKLSGNESPSRKPSSGAPARLTAEEKDELKSLLLQGATDYGFEGDIWTSVRVQWLVKEHFGHSYCEERIRQILHAIGFSSQVPISKDYRQNPDNLQAWYEERLPEAKKKRKKKTV